MGKGEQRGGTWGNKYARTNNDVLHWETGEAQGSAMVISDWFIGIKQDHGVSQFIWLAVKNWPRNNIKTAPG